MHVVLSQDMAYSCIHHTPGSFPFSSRFKSKDCAFSLLPHCISPMAERTVGARTRTLNGPPPYEQGWAQQMEARRHAERGQLLQVPGTQRDGGACLQSQRCLPHLSGVNNLTAVTAPLTCPLAPRWRLGVQHCCLSTSLSSSFLLCREAVRPDRLCRTAWQLPGSAPLSHTPGQHQTVSVRGLASGRLANMLVE